MSENDPLLDILNAHGQDFLNSFAQPDTRGKKRRRNFVQDALPPAKSPKLDLSDDDDVSSEEWQGFGSGVDVEDGIEGEESGEDEEDVDFSGSEAEYDGDDGYTAGTSAHAPAVVVFSESKLGSSSSVPRPTKAQMKAFMSSKVSKLRLEQQEVPRNADAQEDLNEERTNAQNDALLHRLVHTQLLSGSLNPQLNLTSAQRKKALAGRVLELAGGSKLGQGERTVRKKEHARAAKRIRDGIEEKRVERRGKQLAEAKDMGNYHPTLKKLFEESDDQGPKRKREKGLGMGVGRFSRGMLKLSRREINSVNGPSSRGGRFGRGSRERGGRGRGGRRG